MIDERNELNPNLSHLYTILFNIPLFLVCLVVHSHLHSHLHTIFFPEATPGALEKTVHFQQI